MQPPAETAAACRQQQGQAAAVHPCVSPASPGHHVQCQRGRAALTCMAGCTTNTPCWLVRARPSPSVFGGLTCPCLLTPCPAGLRLQPFKAAGRRGPWGGQLHGGRPMQPNLAGQSRLAWCLGSARHSSEPAVACWGFRRVVTNLLCSAPRVLPAAAVCFSIEMPGARALWLLLSCTYGTRPLLSSFLPPHPTPTHPPTHPPPSTPTSFGLQAPEVLRGARASAASDV